ncbi:MAG: c-type cytochrome [Candidatus Rokubacteria bacterium]|nr:c-type cytochrome [Candidatus Rokubacteria bacterium]
MRRGVAALILGTAVVGAGCATPASVPEPRVSELPPLPPDPADNPRTADKIALGKQLFFDKRLSRDGSASCETCHLRDKGWTDAEEFSVRVGGEKNTRHTPTLYNVGYQKLFYWDGRAPTLEANVLAAWRSQMGADPAAIAQRLEAVPAYRAEFQKVFGGPPTEDGIVKALAAYLRTLTSGHSAWDRYEQGRASAVSPDAIEGYKLFTGKAQCVVCHYPPLYTDGLFHNVGLEQGKARPDPGRANVTKDAKDTGAFKTPTLRSVAISAPYFHDASARTLEEAVRYMASGGKPDPNKDPLLRPVSLTDQEIRQITAFLETLTSDEPLVRPTLPQ